MNSIKFLVLILCMLHILEGQKILLISSYDENYDYAIRQLEGVKQGLQKGGIDTNKAIFKSFYLDTLISYPTSLKQLFLAKYVLDLINTWKPDIAITVGSNALTSIAIRYQNLYFNQTLGEDLHEVPFLFCGVYNDLSSNPFPNLITNSTFVGTISGIDIPEPFQKKINVSLSLNPNATQISFVFDDTTSSHNQAQYLEKMIEKGELFSNDLPIVIHNVDTFPNFKSTLIELQNNNTAIIVVLAIKLFENNFKNTSTLPHLISDWVKENVGLTVLGPVEQNFSIDVRNSPNATCSYAGYLAAKVLQENSKKVSYPVLTDPDSIYLEYNANQESFVQIQSLHLPFSELLNQPNFISSLNIYQPIIFQDPIKLYIVHSYSESFNLPVFQAIGFLEALAKQGFARKNYYLRTFWMETKDTFNTPDLIDYVSNVTITDVTTYRPQMIFGTNDNALDLILVPYVNSTTNTKWNCTCVFAGINGDPSSYSTIGNSSSPKLMTGVLERYDFNSLINFSLQINSKIKKITVISDNSKDGNHLKKQIDDAIIQYRASWPPTTSLQFEYFSELQKYILGEPLSEVESNLILFSSYDFKLKNNGLLLGSDVIKWVNANRNGTEISQYSYFVVDGGLLSLGQNPSSSGQSAGYYAAVIYKNQRNVSSLPLIENVSNILSINRQRANLTYAQIPTPIIMRAFVYETSPLISDNEFSNSVADTGICYSIFIFYLIITMISVVLFLFVVIFYNKKGFIRSSSFRSKFYLFIVILGAIRMIQMVLVLNVRPPEVNLIMVFIFYKVGTIVYIGLMMIECMLWINIFQSSFTSEFLIITLKVYCYILFAANAAAQLISIIVFSIFASDAVARNKTKIIAYNQGLYVSRYGSIREEIVQTDTKLRIAYNASKKISFVLYTFKFIIF
eukprot:TRINITY_DN2677_c0_g1_i3.p1 TRINITY_DN2677_c0_g1~~TRINITY_DN2677_c0_g1_i3.p1  ORF type:complete len:907 (-),score=143.62 TRINITY_DN2677_c0_g1_i3:415-3135(-)